MNKQILLIDDDEDEQNIFNEALDKAQLTCKCICASSAKKGIELLNTLIPDYIFLDINMPGMNGLECLMEIKKQKSLKPIPVIMYSTGVNDELTYAAIKLGATACIKKEYSIKDLADTLRQILFC